MRSQKRKPGELALIQEIHRRAAQSAAGVLRLGIGDDCALLRLKADEELAVTTDLSIAGQHFRLDWHPPESVGHRTLARGLSDLAAMGARPMAAFLSLGLPKTLVQGLGKKWVERFLDGFFALAAAQRTPLAGGDLAESTTAVADIVLTGAVSRGKALLRSGARPGDLLYVTGTLGGAAQALSRLAELSECASKSRANRPVLAIPRIPAKLAPRLAPHLYPQPRVKQGRWLMQRGLATAAIDVSDGLSTDLAHLCEESHIAAEVDAAALPVYPGTTLAQALHGGEDYELLFTAAPHARLPRKIAGVPITRIGRIGRPHKAGPSAMLATAQGTQPLAPQGWEHFL